jgi:hypothetical protein
VVHLWNGNPFIETLMGTRRVEELNVFTPDPSQVRLVANQQLIQALLVH